MHIINLPMKIPGELAHDFMSKLHYISESIENFSFQPGNPDRVMVTFKSGCDAQIEKVTQRIQEVATKMCATYHPIEIKIITDRSSRPVPFAGDPHPLLEAEGELYRYGQGRYGIGPRLLKLIHYFDSKICQIASRFHAEFYQFPSLIGADVMHRCHYLSSFPHALTFVTHLREDIDTILEFANEISYRNNTLKFDFSRLDNIECLLSSTVCFHGYAWLQNTLQERPRVLSAIGKCFRFESGNLQGLERLWDFTMREIIFVGSKGFVLEQRDNVIKESARLFDDLGLAYTIQTATDPFFIDNYAFHVNYQSAFDLKYELRAELPYKKSTLAVGSFNFHQDFFGRELNINSKEGPVFTGCVGFGYERMALAFLAQYGLDSKKWPTELANKCGWGNL